MRIIFDNYYRYYNNNDKRTYNATIANSASDTWRQTYAFNENYFTTLVSQNRYEDAAQYAEQFHFKDRVKEDEHRRNIARLRREGEERNALKQQLSPGDYALYNLGTIIKNKLDVRPSLTPGVDRMSMNKPTLSSYYSYDPKSNIVDKLVTDLNRLGSIQNKDGSMRYASSLSVTFEPEVQHRWGVSWLDWAKADNPNNIEAYYKRLGMSEEELKQNGIEVIHEGGNSSNGRTTLKFSKSNPLTFTLLSKLYDYDTNRNTLTGLGETIRGYDENGKELGSEVLNNLEQRNGDSNFLPLFQTIQAAENKVNEVNEALGRKNHDPNYSQLRVGPLMTDEIYQTQKLYQQGKLSDEQYKYNMAVAEQHIFEVLASIPNSQKMYSNYNNKEATDETLQELDNISRSKLQQYLSYNLDKRPKEISLQTAVQNGVYGVLVTVNAHEKEKDTDIDLDERRIQVFMPGLQSDMVQQVFDNDPASRAVTEANSIIDYGYKFKLSENESLQATENGTFTLERDGQSVEIDRAFAEKKIQESILVNDAKHELIDAYINNNGEITDVAKCREMAKQFAIRMANELYSELPEIGTQNASIYSAKEIFNEAKVTDKNTQYEMWNKILSARNIYELLLKELNNYI